MESVTLTLRPRPPFRLDLTVWVLRRRPDNLLDHWDGATYRRALVVGEGVALVAVRQSGTADSPVLEVTVSAEGLTAGMVEEAQKTLTRMLGLNVDLDGFYDLAAGDERLHPLAARFRGMKPPRYPTLFEGVVNAVACQQVTLTLGIRLLNRLVLSFGLPVSGEPQSPRAYPRPREAAQLEPEAFRALGFSRRKGETVIALARSILAGKLDAGELEALDDDSALRLLVSQRGLGRWSGEYVLLRTLGRINVFPGDDVGAQKNLQRWLQLPAPPGYPEVHSLLERWHLYGGLIYFHLLLDRLQAAGHLCGEET